MPDEASCPIKRGYRPCRFSLTDYPSRDLLEFGPASPKVKTFHRADSEFYGSCWVADTKDLSDYGDKVLRIRKLRIRLLWLFFDGRRFSWFARAFAFDIKRVN